MIENVPCVLLDADVGRSLTGRRLDSSSSHFLSPFSQHCGLALPSKLEKEQDPDFPGKRKGRGQRVTCDLVERGPLLWVYILNLPAHFFSDFLFLVGSCFLYLMMVGCNLVFFFKILIIDLRERESELMCTCERAPMRRRGRNREKKVPS